VHRRLALVVLALGIAACGGSHGQAPAPRAAAAGGRVLFHAGPGGAATLGSITWHLDQLAPAPGAGLTPPVLLAVLRATTVGPAGRVHTAWITLLDDAGGSWSPAGVPVYVPIDGLDNAPVEPDHGAAGVVAFRLPSGRRGIAVSVAADGGRVVLDAPR
jgi:hypothetical protein